MNLVELVKSQLTPDLLGKLAAQVGASESQAKSAVGAAVPALLSALAGSASQAGGAQKLLSALTGLGSMSDMLSGASLEKGTGLLGSLLGGSTLSAIVSTSPSETRASRIVRSFSARPTASAQAKNSCSTKRLANASAVSICNRGPVPTQSLARVNEIPRAYELLAISYRERLRSVRRTSGLLAALAESPSAAAQWRTLSIVVVAAS